MDDSISWLKSVHFVQLSKPANAAAMNNARICFFFHKVIGLIEIVEQNGVVR